MMFDNVNFKISKENPFTECGFDIESIKTFQFLIETGVHNQLELALQQHKIDPAFDFFLKNTVHFPDKNQVNTMILLYSKHPQFIQV